MQENDAAAGVSRLSSSHRESHRSAFGEASDAPTGWLLTAGLVVLLLAAIAAFGGPEPSTANAADQRPRATLAPLPSVVRGRTLSQRRAAIIRRVFGKRHGGDAVTVARCESRLDPRARNGQYRGVFQMGSAERARYGHGSTVAAQARAARRYFNATGRDWSPWTCKP